MNSFSKVLPNLAFLIHEEIHMTKLNARPNCSYVISSLANFLSNPGYIHWQAVKRVLRYIKGTLNHHMIYSYIENGHILEGYSDADWIGNTDTRRSTSGYYFFLTSTVISWASYFMGQ